MIIKTDHRFCLHSACGLLLFLWPIRVALCLLALLLSPALLAQVDRGAGIGTGPGTGTVTITLDRLGVGTAARKGGWLGIRVSVVDSIDKPRNVVVRVSSQDPDGDTSVSERAIALNGQEKLSVWLYHWLSFRSDLSDWRITVHEAAEGSVTDAAGRELPRLGALLGTLALPARPTVDAIVSLYGVVGSSNYGLLAYAIQQSPQDNWVPFGHERTEIVTGLTPSEFPDRWQGLANFEAIIWGSGEPSELRTESRRALREWIERGGHFIVVLPSAGQTWTNENLTDLYDAMPLVTVTKHENQDLAGLKYLFTSRTDRNMPTSATIHSFAPMPEIKVADAVPILKDTANRTIVVRRSVGAGAVTWIGIDINQRPLINDTLSTASFWHRILGRRGSTDDPSDIQTPASQSIAPPLRSPFGFDTLIPTQINKESKSAVGLLLAFIVFVIYWLVAGPVGYGILRAKDLRRHGWLAYLGAAFVFTGIAWGGALLLRPGSAQVIQVTVLDHVNGEALQRARTWMSVLVPHYGEGVVKIGATNQQTRPGNSLVAWDAFTSDGTVTFTDQREYRTPLNSLETLAFPARQTIKQFQMDWSGGPPWAAPIVAPPPGATEAARIRLVRDGIWEKDQPILDGILTHNLPSALENVTVVVIRGQPPIRRLARMTQRRDLIVGEGFVFNYRGGWNAQEELDLGLLTTASSVPSSLTSYLSSLRPQASTLGYEADNLIKSGNFFQHMIASSFFHMLPPPDNDNRGNYVYVAQRRYTHGLDLSRWFTQPCIIIIGEVANAPGPVPVSVDGRDVEITGRTIFRWIYPLEGNPPRIAETFDKNLRELPSDLERTAESAPQDPQ